eukprot:1159063-Pelagomonas_calceolata.AAC.11
MAWACSCPCLWAWLTPGTSRSPHFWHGHGAAHLAAGLAKSSKLGQWLKEVGHFLLFCAIS